MPCSEPSLAPTYAAVRSNGPCQARTIGRRGGHTRKKRRRSTAAAGSADPAHLKLVVDVDARHLDPPCYVGQHVLQPHGALRLGRPRRGVMVDGSVLGRVPVVVVIESGGRSGAARRAVGSDATQHDIVGHDRQGVRGEEGYERDTRVGRAGDRREGERLSGAGKDGLNDVRRGAASGDDGARGQRRRRFGPRDDGVACACTGR